jgi:hypothetical protein
VDVFYLTAKETLEDVIWRIVQRKHARAVRMLQDRVGSFRADRTYSADEPDEAISASEKAALELVAENDPVPKIGSHTESADQE